MGFFKEGCWYKWVGPKTRPLSWNEDGYMDFILDGKPHKCIKVRGDIVAVFEDQPVDKNVGVYKNRRWAWYGAYANMVEIKYQDDNGNLLFDFA